MWRMDVCGLAVVLLACGEAADAGETAASSGTSSAGESDVEDGGEGVSICMSEDECSAPNLESLSQPAAVPSAFNVHECLASPPECEAVPFCRCLNDVDGRGGDFGAFGQDCILWGRANDCLYPAAEFPSCTIGDPNSCAAVCEDVYSRQVADAAATHDVDTRGSRCVSGTCQAITVIDARCFVVPDVEPFDCALTDEEMFAAFDLRHAVESDSGSACG